MHVVSVCRHCGSIIWLPWQCPLPNRKIGSDLSSAPKTLSFGEKIVIIGPADTEIIVLQEIIKKEKKKKEITEGKIYSPVGNIAERALL